MSRKVTHYSNIGDFHLQGMSSGGVAPKTLCNREMTRLYRFSDDVEQVTCVRCIKKLEKLHMLQAPVVASVPRVRITSVRDIGSCGDEKTDLYLQRLGIC
jgi:hypothetical protein